jgi:hypothetical protein
MSMADAASPPEQSDRRDDRIVPVTKAVLAAMATLYLSMQARHRRMSLPAQAS